MSWTIFLALDAFTICVFPLSDLVSASCGIVSLAWHLSGVLLLLHLGAALLSPLRLISLVGPFFDEVVRSKG